MRGSPDTYGIHVTLSWQAVADEIRASSSDVRVEIVPCDLGRAAGVATLCAAAARRDVTLAVLNAGVCESGALCEQPAARIDALLALNVWATTALQRGQSARAVKAPSLAVPQLDFCASPARAWRLWAPRHPFSEAQPLGALPPPRGLELS